MLEKLKRLCRPAVIAVALVGGAPAYADVAEFNLCSSWQDVPDWVQFKRETVGFYGQVTSRTERYHTGAVVNLPKNPEDYAAHAPLHARNCTAGALPDMWNPTMALYFRIKGTNYFGTVGGPAGVGNHFAVLARGDLIRTNSSHLPASHRGRGFAIFFVDPALPTSSRIEVENFSAGRYLANNRIANGPVVFEDGKWYTVQMHVRQEKMDYTIYDDATGAYMNGSFFEPAGPPLSTGLSVHGQGYGFAPLCNDADLSCSAVENFELMVKDIQYGWFY